LLGFRSDATSDINGRNWLLFGKLIDVNKPLFLVIVTRGLIELVPTSLYLLCDLCRLSPSEIEGEKGKFDVLSYLQHL
jgi:hypothetical protein